MLKDTSFQGWEAVALSNEGLELVIPKEIGPRISFCGRPDGPNLFAERAGQMGGKGEATWCIRGGHRLWHSPEASPRTYGLDNDPIALTEVPNGVALEQPLETTTGIGKKLTVELMGHGTAKITHELTNHNLWPVELAPWALSVMHHGGFATVPLLPKESHEGNLLPKYTLIPWTYTDFSEPAWEWGKDYIGIEVSESKNPQKIGISNYPGWLSYWQAGGTFVKYSPICPGSTYPDFNSAAEIFHCDWMIELETLGPLVKLAAGEAVQHVEWWTVIPDLPKCNSDVLFREKLAPAVQDWIAGLE